MTLGDSHWMLWDLPGLLPLGLRLFQQFSLMVIVILLLFLLPLLHLGSFVVRIIGILTDEVVIPVEHPVRVVHTLSGQAQPLGQAAGVLHHIAVRQPLHRLA